jgi:glycosyltransferase involved in cell wall biosynthesis
VQRFAYEIVKRLDLLATPHELAILVPEYYENKNPFTNIDFFKYGNHRGRLWTQLDYPRYVKKTGIPGIFFTNLVPVTYPKGIVVIHDLIFKIHPEYFNKSLRGKISVFWRNFNNNLAIRKKMKIVTVSNFTKSEIVKTFHISSDNIDVVYNSWEQMKEISEDQVIFAQYPEMKKNDYYFTLSSIAPNKNFQWILKAADKYPNETFVIAGSGDLKKLSDDLHLSLKNVIFLGYITDEQVKAAMHYCKAFLFPTLYEGFGITPLEAIANGAKRIIISDIPVMREIYGNAASYINPHVINLETKDAKESSKKVLDKYSWDTSAQKFYDVIKNSKQ